MKSNHSITHFELSNFLASGAFFRRADKYFLFAGLRTCSGDGKSQANSVTYYDFYETGKNRKYVADRFYELSRDEFYHLLGGYLEQVLLSSSHQNEYEWTNPREQDFQDSYSRIMTLISQGQITKAVPVGFARCQAEFSLGAQVKALLHLLKLDSALYPYGFWADGVGSIGATPELLFEVEGLQLQTMALAGTLPKGSSTTAADLMKSTKDLYEHQLVVQDLFQVLKSLGSVRFYGPSILELPMLFHLITRFSVELHEEHSASRFVQWLHPTPALGVAPRGYGFRWMQDLPGQEERQGFGAPLLFEFGENKSVCLVSIRQLQWGPFGMKIGAGCGIVKESQFQVEWRELLRKIDSVRQVLGI